MTNIESTPIEISRSPEKVHDFLSDLRNYAKLIPQDMGVVEADESHARIDLKGLGKFALKIEERTNEVIRLKPEGKLPFPFHVEWELQQSGESTRVVGRILAKLNPFVKMMVEPKLRQFVDKQAGNLKSFLENEIEE